MRNSYRVMRFPRLLAQIESALTPGNTAAIYLQERSVDPRALSAAAWKTAKKRCVDFSAGDEVIAVTVSNGSAKGVSTTKTLLAAPKVVNCAGAWSGAIAPHPFPTRPVKGQMLCLLMPSRNLLEHVVRTPRVYLIPRSDGRLLVGATVEEAGFDKRTVPSTIQRQHQAALELVPKLRDAKILRRLGRPAPRNAGQSADSWRNRNARILCCHRPLPRRHSAGSDHRGSDGRCDRMPHSKPRSHCVLAGQIFLRFPCGPLCFLR